MATETLSLQAEIDRLRAVNRRLIFTLTVARAALEEFGTTVIPDGMAYCPRCDNIVYTVDDGATCAACRLVL